MPAEVWDDAERLERYVGRWSRLVAREFVAWLHVPPGGRWLDVGSGTGAVSQTGDEASIQKPFGFSTSYTAMIITNFDQADVRGYMLSLDYDLARVGFEGVRFHAAWGKGNGAPDLANGGFADQDELDLRFVYEPHRGRLQGLRVELEYIDWQVFDQPFPNDDLDQVRAIVNYTVPLL